jgi:hypothetical protein
MVELDHLLSTSLHRSQNSRILTRMLTYSYRVFLIAIFAIVNSVVPISQSNAIGSGACTSTVGSDSGVVVANSGGFCYVAFTANGTNSWTAPSGVTSVDLLIIAGGGAGGSGAWGGGGGAGEVVLFTGYSVSSSSAKNLSVGRGGVSGTATLDPLNNRSEAGTVSWVGSASEVVAQGGGFGASYGYGSGAGYTTGGNGGSGGGGNEQNPASPGGTSTKSTSGSRTGYGNIGGSGSTLVSGGGGGGAGTAGSNAATSTGGNGGAGTNLFASWLSAINSGMAGVTGWQSATSTGFIGAGGGGGASATRGNGGVGGGGNGIINATSGNGESGVANTGSGGGGTGYNSSTAQRGGNGGSGLIIVKYAQVLAVINSFNLTGNATTATYRSSATVSINVSTPAKITFRAKGIAIAGCKNRTASGSGSSYTATCSWKPSVRGQVNLTASIVPTGPWTNVTSTPLSIWVINRSGARA